MITFLLCQKCIIVSISLFLYACLVPTDTFESSASFIYCMISNAVACIIHATVIQSNIVTGCHILRSLCNFWVLIDVPKIKLFVIAHKNTFGVMENRFN